MAVQLVGQNTANVANVDSLGNLYVTQSPAAISAVAAPWTNATILNTTQILFATGGFPAIILQFNQTSTITAGAATFEGTVDGINWTSLTVNQVLDPTSFAPASNPYTFVANTNQSFLLLVGTFQSVRVRLSTAILGTGNVTTYWTLHATNPVGNSSTIVTNTVSTNLTQVGGSAVALGQTVMADSFPVVIASDQSPLPVAQSGALNVNQTIGVAGFEKITDGTNIAAVKAASSAPIT